MAAVHNLTDHCHNQGLHNLGINTHTHTQTQAGAEHTCSREHWRLGLQAVLCSYKC